MVDVALYGNLTKDIIFDGFNNKTSLGSIANVWYSLLKINRKLNIHLAPTDIGTALIYVDIDTNTRYSRPNLSVISNKPKIVNSRWSHIMYLNHLSDLSFIKDIKNSIVSADIAGKIKFDHDILKYIDYLFVSDEDIIDIHEMNSKIKGNLILHSNNGSITYIKNMDPIIINHEIITGVNVLGAGDFFASAFIDEMLSNKQIDAALKSAHNKTINFIYTNA